MLRMTWLHFDITNMLFLLVNILILSFAQALSQEPRFNVVTKNVTVVAGQTAVLPCSVDYLGTYRVVWQSPRGKTLTFEDRRIISDERISLERPYIKEWNLHIRHVKISDSGTYQCQINTDPVQVRPVMLHVHQQAKIIDHLSSALSVSVREGETVELICNVTGFPEPTVQWYRIHTGLMAEGEDTGKKRIGEGEVLVIHNVSRYCDDKYECVAFNGVPPAATREIRVHVEFPPEVRLPNQRIGQVLGRSTILECEITAYPHILSVWRRNGEDISRSAKYTTEIYNEGGNKVTLSLKVQSLTTEDYGEYECYALNLLGNDAETMVLYEYHNPVKKTTTTTTTTTTIQPPWSQNVDQRGGYSKYDNGDNHYYNSNSGRNDNPNQSAWQQERQEGEKPSEQSGSGDNNYPPYNNWRNPEYSYEPEAEGGSVISDPKDGKNRASRQTNILYTVVVLLLFLKHLTVR